MSRTVFRYFDYFTSYFSVVVFFFKWKSKKLLALFARGRPITKSVNTWSPGGSFTVHKMTISSPIPDFKGLI